MKRFMHRLCGWLIRRCIGVGRAAALADRRHVDRLGRRGPAAQPGGLNRSTRFQILSYHRVLPEPDALAIDTVPLAQFKRQIEMLAEQFHCVSLGEVVAAAAEGQIEPNTVCITFDDGYRDNYQFAFPVLREFGVPATIFLATGVVGTDKMLWHERVLDLIARATPHEVAWPINGTPRWTVKTQPARAQFAGAVLEQLKRVPPGERGDAIEKLAEVCEPNASLQTERTMLNWPEIREMHRAGIGFGAHTVSHSIVSVLDDDALESELSESKLAVETALGTRVEHFAYPNGQAADYDARTISRLKALGFTCALTTRRGLNTPADDPYEWRRVSPWDFDLDRFSLQMVTIRL